MNIVLDTNILVSALLTPGRNASMVLSSVFSYKNTICYDYRIIDEYERVLHYNKFHFNSWESRFILDFIEKDGFSVISDPEKDVSFEKDESDRMFYEVAKCCNAILITGNLAHFPEKGWIVSPADFCMNYL